MKNTLRKIIILIVLVTLIVSQYSTFSLAQSAKALPKLEVASPTAILIDAKTGQVLFEKNSAEKMYPASITKIMTAVLALEKGDLNSYVTVSERAVSELDGDSSNIGLVKGERLTLEQLLYAALLSSANEGANALGEAIGGTKEDFAVMMTKRAKELGAKNTHFVNPTGLPDSNHYTTAYDMALIAKHAMTIPKFRGIVGTTHYTLPPTNKYKKAKTLINTNQLIRKDTKYFYNNAIGIKTGYTIAAGATLVAAAEKNGVTLITVVLNSPIKGSVQYRYIDAAKLFDFGFENFKYQKIVDKNEAVSKINIKNSIKKVTATPQNDFILLMTKDAGAGDVKLIKRIKTSINAPVRKGEKVGYILIVQNGVIMGQVNVIAQNGVSL